MCACTGKLSKFGSDYIHLIIILKVDLFVPLFLTVAPINTEGFFFLAMP